MFLLIYQFNWYNRKEFYEQKKIVKNEETKEINLKDDVIFKAFFSRKGNEEFLVDFLESLLKIEIKQIKIQEEVDLERLSKDEKGGSIDLQAELNDGILVNVELQVKKKESFENRTVYYGSKMIARETRRRNRV